MSLSGDGTPVSPRGKVPVQDAEENVDVKITPLFGMQSCLDEPPDSSILHEVVRHAETTLPAKHYDADTTEPISCGLHSLEQLLTWKRSEANPFNIAVVPRAGREPPLTSCPRRTLVSHDMMGGYLDDRFIQGTTTEVPYAFYHWQYIDIFNYFTHNLVTVPPAVWTNAAHKHGVVVLGTFITEWTEGARVCEAFLKDEESYRAVADKLVQISLCYGFDGWLINIENVLSEEAVKNTPLFLRYLSDQMHERIAGSLVLWYDSVIQSGELKWQNELNDFNRMFFDSCDGFFTNYNWTETSLEWMSGYSGAHGRHADIYVGVDVFARGEVVGGKLETNKALEMIRKHSFSAAIFAPGWVYESLENKKEFCQKQDMFWHLLTDYLYVHHLSIRLPFISSFCQGFGKTIYCRGQVESQRNWVQLSAQDVQPLYLQKQLEGQGWLRTRGCSEDAWDGGSSFLLEGLIPATHTSPVCIKIFSLHVPVSAGTLVRLVYKCSPGVSVSLELSTKEASPVSLKDLPGDHHLLRDLPQFCREENPDGWIVRCSLLEVQDCSIQGVCVNIQKQQDCDTPFLCRLGQIMFQDVTHLLDSSPPIQSLCVYDLVWLRGAGPSPDSTSPRLILNTTVRWNYPSHLTHYFRVYWRRLRGPDPRIPAGPLELVGRAYSNLYRVTELALPEPPGLIELVVEPVSKAGVPVPESHWGRRSISYHGE
ncbi:cytosolic endo-beta-N-acetylglucosaminidase isoform 1-T1 [Synchiropus picturatus]